MYDAPEALLLAPRCYHSAETIEKCVRWYITYRLGYLEQKAQVMCGRLFESVVASRPRAVRHVSDRAQDPLRHGTILAPHREGRQTVFFPPV